LVAAELVEAPMEQQVLMVTHLFLELSLRLAAAAVALELLLVLLVVLAAAEEGLTVGLELLVKDSVEETRRVLEVVTTLTHGEQLVVAVLAAKELMEVLTLAVGLVELEQLPLLLGLQ
jgi:hypothetical protein